jgi:hypothetical protein
VPRRPEPYSWPSRMSPTVRVRAGQIKGEPVRIFIRTLMAVSLIMADAAHAASLATPEGERKAETKQVASYDPRLKNILDRDERTWKRVSASICAGCGSPPPPLEIARATPLYMRAQRDTAIATPNPEATASTSAARPASVRRAALRAYEGKRTRVVRSKPMHMRVAARAQRYARYSRLRIIRYHRRLALLQAQRRHALIASRAQHTAHLIRVAVLGLDGSERVEAYSADERRPIPLPPARPDTLCADDRGLATTGARSSTCVGSP